MKFSEKEKIFFKNLKDVAKPFNWKFKSNFTHKIIHKFFFTSDFYLMRNMDVINGYLSFKPYECDNVFWDIINEAENKNQPQSFRGEAAFCVRPYKLLNFTKEIKDITHPSSDLKALLRQMENSIQTTLKKVSSWNDYLNMLYESEREYSVGIITILIMQNHFWFALEKIHYYKKNDFNSGFRFEKGKDFYDLAEEYIMNKTFANRVDGREP